MKILLANENIYGSVSNEETFWSILGKGLPNTKTIALKDHVGDFANYVKEYSPDILVTNSILGDVTTPENTKKIVLLQDNFIVMDKIVPKTFLQRASRFIKGNSHFYPQSVLIQKEAIKNADKVVAVSSHIAESYEISAEIIPIGTDAELFCPMDKEKLRKKYAIPKGVFVKIFVGSAHKVKGFDLILKQIKKDTTSFYILVLKDENMPKLNFPNGKIFNRISQKELAELYNCADLFVGRSRVETLWLAPLEAMFCDVPVDVTPVGIFADWKPANINPRMEAFKKGLDKETMIKRWESLISRLA